MRILAGDVGGTYGRLALYEAADADGLEAVAGLSMLRERTYESRAHEGLVSLVRAFLAELDTAPDRACIGVACPVVYGICRLPNLDWEVDARTFAEDIGIPGARLINDFDAIGHGLPHLGPDDVAELQAGEPKPRGTLGLIGAGTGLGEGYLTWADGRYRVHSSEGGHVDFAPRTPLEAQLLEYLTEVYGHVSSERVVSGPGLHAIYRFLRDRSHGREREEVRREMEETDPPAVISRRALEGTDELSVKALDVFVSAYGAQAGNLALTVQSEGGLYVAGGIAPAILEKLREGAFLEAFTAKGRMRDLMERIPVRVVLESKVGLLGAAAAALAE